jgi:hypothetical protein
MTRTMIRTKAAPFNDGSIEPNLGSRYGEIGISAVTAALQYKNPVRLQTRHEATAFHRTSAAHDTPDSEESCPSGEQVYLEADGTDALKSQRSPARRHRCRAGRRL